MSDHVAFGTFNRLRGLVQGDGLRAQLLRGGVGSAVIQVANRALSLALGILLARTLGAEGYGVYAYAFAIMSLLMVFAEAGVPTLLLREVAAAQGREEWGVLRGALRRSRQFVAFTSITMALLGLAVLMAFAGETTTASQQTIGMMLLVLPVAALVKTSAHAMRGLHRVVTGQSVELLFRPLLVLLFVAAIFGVWPSLREPQYAMAAQFAAALLVLAASTYLLRRYLPDAALCVAHEYRSREWLRSALPFTLIGGAGIINNQADIIMLGWFRPADEIGVYRVATQGSILVAFGLQAVSAVAAPQFARLYAQGDRERLQRLVTMSGRAVLLAALPVALAFILAGGAIAKAVFGADFVASHTPMAILAVGQLSLGLLGLSGPLLSMAGYEAPISRAIWVSAITNVLLNLLFIPILGTAGAALSSAATVIGWHVHLYVFAKKTINISVFPLKRMG